MQLDDILRALSHPTRREILWLVWDRSLLAGDLADRFDVAGPTVSAHLKVLRETGLVEVTRDGTRRLYRAKPEVLQLLQRTLFSRGLPPGAQELVARAAQLPNTPVARPAFEIATQAEVGRPIDAAWAMWTDPDQMAWVGDDPASEPIPGGAFGFTTDFGIRVRGIYSQVAPPVFLAFRWDFSGDEVPMPPGENITYVLFVSRGRSTRIELRQYVFDEALVPFMQAGWTQTFQRLAAVDGGSLKP